MTDKVVKGPRAPRRYQVEVDAARHEANLLRDEVKELRQRIKTARAVIREWKTYPQDYPRAAFAADILAALATPSEGDER